MNATALENFERHLRANPYPGRGLVVGRGARGGWLQLYWIMGRSAGSRNRVFTARGATLCTARREARASVGDAALTLYEAMLELPGRYLVSNGEHTRTLADALARGERYEDALARCEREPDAPHYTPRISALLAFDAGAARLAFSILKANPHDPRQTDRFHYHPAPPPPGFGLGLSTYAGDGDPLPAFRGEPLSLPLSSAAFGDKSGALDEPAALLTHYWEALNPANRVALALKSIPPRGDAAGELLLRMPG